MNADSERRMRASVSPRLRSVAAVLLLTALNLSVCWRLFKVDVTEHFSSIEGSFVAIARYLSTHWGDFSWWPLWHCGMPYQDTYVPLLHLVVAAVASIGHLTAARAYHGVTGGFYALGAATLYLMAVRLGAARGAAFLAGLFYSLFSPSALVMPEVAADIGGWWFGRRLQVLTVYGEGPHISAMTLIPVVILALENALAKRTGRSLAGAAVAISLVFLTNVPGTMAVGLGVFCWISAQPKERLKAAWILAAGAAAFAYGLACFGLPPSSVRTVLGNVGPMHSGFSNSLRYGPVWLVLLLGAVAAVGYLLARTRLPLVARFAILNAGLIAVLAVKANADKFELLPQVGRLHLEMEMGACLLLGAGVWEIYRRIPSWTRPVAIALCLGPVLLQAQHYRGQARQLLQNADLAKRSEYTTARWLEAHMHGGRVYTDGSTSFWLNAFTDTPQLIGCCDQGLAMPILNWVRYAIDYDASPAGNKAAQTWMRALGVEALVVSDAASTDEYKTIVSPTRFDALFPVLHREHGDTIYGVFPGTASLAHVLRPGEAIPSHPNRQVVFADVERYAAAVTDAARSVAEFTWLRGSAARIRANLRRDDRVSVQVAWFSGWKAYVGGQRRRIDEDGLGFMEIEPGCEGACEIALVWTGPADLPLAALVSMSALILLGVMISRARSLPGL